MAILVIFLVIENVLVVSYQRSLLSHWIEDHINTEVEVLGDISTDAVLRRDFVLVQRLLTNWGKHFENVVDVRAVAPNGFVLAEYKREKGPVGKTYRIRKDINDNGKNLLHLDVVGDFSSLQAVITSLFWRLLLGSAVLVVMMGFAIWYFQKKLALLPMEEEIQRRGEIENKLTRARDNLEKRVQERTSELSSELEERKRIEETLRLREERIRLLLESTAEAIYGIDTEGICTFVNASCLRLIGYEKEEDVLGKPMHELIHHSYQDGSRYPYETCRICRAFRNSVGTHSKNEVFWRSDGTSFHVEFWSHPVIDKGQVIGAVVTFLDVTEQRKLEDQLRQSQKMEAIGTLTGGIAHDFNNILTAIIGFGEFLKDEVEKDSQNMKYVDLILSSAARATALTQGLLAFGRKQPSNPRPVNLNDVVKEVQEILNRLKGEDIEMEIELFDEALMTMADEGQIHQILINLTSNARDAMPRGGTVSIRTQLAMVEEDFVDAMGYGEPGPYALVMVSDTGSGMSPEVKEHIFEPFFTTKATGKGTGLGLSIVYGIIRQHNGYINVYSEPGEGTTFKIYLPMIKGGPVSLEPEEAAAEVPGGTETILVAEDDDAIRSLVRLALERYGYHVIDAADGEKAIGVFKEHVDKIDLALVDVVMPKLDGKAVYDEIKKERPETKVVLMSGYSSDIIQKKGIFDETVPYITKPISPNELLRTIRRHLDSSC